MSQQNRVRLSRQYSPAISVAASAVSRAADASFAPSKAVGNHDIRRVALSATRGSRALRVQRAMSVSQPGDPSEVEADRVADDVMRMPMAPDVLSREGAVARETLPEEEEPLQTKRVDRFEIAREGLPEEEEPLQMKRVSRAPLPDVESGGDVSRIVDQGLSGGGQPLDGASRSFFEPRLGQDLSGIRIHTGSAASQSAEQVSARAYAVGNNIAFRDGEYNPGTSAGRHLLAHELAHTVQQGATKPLSRSKR